MSTITRRNLLKQSPAALAVATLPASAALHTDEKPKENPELIAAYDRFIGARAEVAAAEDALEWLADEWRHLWPLAPEEILGFANADKYTAGAERDIIGRLIVRDTSDMTKRASRKWRDEYPRCCFSVHKPDWFQDVIDRWEKPRTGKTEKALARNLAEQARVLAEFRTKLRLCEEYHAETERLTQVSGVEQAKQRIKTAKAELDEACRDISVEPAITAEGLRLKAASLLVQDEGMAPYLRTKGGALGAMARFIDATLDVIGRASV